MHVLYTSKSKIKQSVMWYEAIYIYRFGHVVALQQRFFRGGCSKNALTTRYKVTLNGSNFGSSPTFPYLLGKMWSKLWFGNFSVCTSPYQFLHLLSWGPVRAQRTALRWLPAETNRTTTILDMHVNRNCLQEWCMSSVIYLSDRIRAGRPTGE